MPLFTYGHNKKKVKRIPKYVVNEASKNEHDVFEVLKKDTIKTIRPIRNPKRQARDLKKESPKMSPGKSIFDKLLNESSKMSEGSSTFDKLLNEGPVNKMFSFSLPRCCGNASLNNTSYEKDECNDVSLEARKPRASPSTKSWKDLRNVQGGGLWEPKKECGASSSINLEDESADTLLLKAFADSFNEPRDAICPPKSTSDRISAFISPILPLFPNGSTSTPCGKQLSSMPQRLSFSSPSIKEQSANLMDSVFSSEENIISVDMFSSPDPNRKVCHINDPAVSVDMFSCEEHDLSGLSACPVSKSQQVEPTAFIEISSQDLSESVIVSDVNHHVNPTDVVSLSYGHSSNQEYDGNAVALSLNSLRSSESSNGNDDSISSMRGSNADPWISDVVCANKSPPLKHIKETGIDERGGSSPGNSDALVMKECCIVLNRCNINDQRSIGNHASPSGIPYPEWISDSTLNTLAGDESHLCLPHPVPEDVNDHTCEPASLKCEVKLYRCDDPQSTIDVGDTNLSLTAASFNCLKPRKSSLCKNSQEGVVLKPGKQWRRSISILAKVRSSIGETSADVRKSLAFDDSKVKGKRYESTVDSIVQMQSTINHIPEEDESFNSSCLIELPDQRVEEAVCEGDSEEKSGNGADEIYRLCSQDGPLPFNHFYPERMKEHCKKIGEGVYGEVFFYSRPSDCKSSVIKIIPIEGSLVVNEEPQKTFKEIMCEIRVAQELSNLRAGIDNVAWTFNEVQAIRCVQGSYPSWLLELWDDFDNEKGSDNDSPEIFQDDQLYIVLELNHGGKDLESFVFSSADQGLAAFKQTALTLAVGERALEFEHRDLHWGNVLISNTKDKEIKFVLDGNSFSTPSGGIQISIIDFTLSRISDPSSGRPIFYDLSRDETLFTAQGDYQYEIYRMMKDYCRDKWDTFSPKTNIAWLHYLLDKLCTVARYRKRSGRVHHRAIEQLNEMRERILTYCNVTSFIHSIF